ncbi:MAG: hypothetical protein JWQ50_5104 [Caballeronia mineralivorans]|nr:hypothetical protein [Caballeronia mineralivorans]
MPHVKSLTPLRATAAALVIAASGSTYAQLGATVAIAAMGTSSSSDAADASAAAQRNRAQCLAYLRRINPCARSFDAFARLSTSTALDPCDTASKETGASATNTAAPMRVLRMGHASFERSCESAARRPTDASFCFFDTTRCVLFISFAHSGLETRERALGIIGIGSGRSIKCRVRVQMRNAQKIETGGLN